jgi:uncharacterized membrane protein
MNSEIWFSLIPIAGVAVMLHYLPLWRRQNLWFGVTVPTGYRETYQARIVLRQYRRTVWSLAAVAVVLSAVAVWQNVIWLIPLASLFLTFSSIAAFARGRNQTLPDSTQVTLRSAPTTSDTETLPGGPVMAIGPFGILLAAALYLHANWQSIPARYPMHWSGSGVPNRWADKSPLTVFAPLLAGAILNLFLLFMGEAILKYSPRARVANTAAWTARFRLVNLRLLMVVTWGVSLLLSWFAILPLPTGPLLKFTWIAPLLLLAVITPFVWQMVSLSQEPGSGSDGTPDRAWKLGLFYYNPDDPALIVERRFGIGYTFNFGNRASWWLLGLLTLPILFLVLA